MSRNALRTGQPGLPVASGNGGCGSGNGGWNLFFSFGTFSLAYRASRADASFRFPSRPASASIRAAAIRAAAVSGSSRTISR
jgi:hypothetical protein